MLVTVTSEIEMLSSFLHLGVSLSAYQEIWCRNLPSHPAGKIIPRKTARVASGEKIYRGLGVLLPWLYLHNEDDSHGK